ncbi:hypothetical protein M407DRAFT_195218 [Tulasnella calospora MUT 4182]|uniref:AB hydrolase-1 domain-containing protein n=1 Tax=Tulasnella calospora MUT 4182 TaxID=1051891 RepID=A0A0C3QA34_9AGAM|nr:hypothetical protein M407DRAFT_195218 [Tulasnella calospora MUT 4182]
MADVDPNRGFLWRAQRVFLYIGIVYVAGASLLLLPYFQRHVVFMHLAQWPLFAEFDAPHYYGLAPFKTVNLKLTTADNVNIGAWYVLSEPAYKAIGGISRSSPPTSEEVSKSLKDHPTVLFFHGNAANRAIQYRVQMYGSVSAQLGANVLVIDYRGFGDSEGTPTEEGVNLDALASWKWLVDNGANPQDIVVMGHSLGTGIATKLVTQLQTEGVEPRALVVVAPFSSIEALFASYSLGGLIPLFRPLQIIPFVDKLVAKYIHTRFSTIDLIGQIRVPTLLVHAKDDTTIPYSHSGHLFEAILDPYLPAWPFDTKDILKTLALTAEQLQELSKVAASRMARLNELVTTKVIGPSDALFANVKRFKAQSVDATFALLEKGDHSPIVRFEGVLGLVGQVAGIGRN